MDRNQIDQLLMVYGSKIPANMYPMVKSRLETMDSNTANVAFMQMKDPTISLLISIFLGGYGIEGLATGNGPDQTGSTDNANQPGNNSAPANPRANPAPPAQ